MHRLTRFRKSVDATEQENSKLSDEGRTLEGTTDQGETSNRTDERPNVTEQTGTNNGSSTTLEEDETSSVHDSHSLIVNEIKAYEGFVGRPSLKEDGRWVSLPGSGKHFVDGINDDIRLVAPFKIIAESYFVGPCGNYLGSFNLQNAKYRFIGGPPDNAALRDMYDTAIGLLKDLERDVAKNVPCRNLFYFDNNGKIQGVNFSSPCFFKRSKPYIDIETTDLDTLNATGGRTEDTESNVHPLDYPMTKDQRKAYAEISDSYAIGVLPVYDGEKLLPSGALYNTLWDATVRVHFTLVNHYFKEKRYHSITAEVVAMSIIERSPNGPPSPARKRILDGPLTPQKDRALGKKARFD